MIYKTFLIASVLSGFYAFYSYIRWWYPLYLSSRENETQLNLFELLSPLVWVDKEHKKFYWKMLVSTLLAILFGILATFNEVR